MNIQMTPKRLQLLHEVVPSAKVMALLVNPANSTVAETQLREAFSVAPTLGVDLHVLHASTNVTWMRSLQLIHWRGVDFNRR